LSSLDFKANPLSMIIYGRKIGGVLRGRFLLAGETDLYNEE